MNVKDVMGAMDDLVEAHGVKPNENIYVKSTHGAELIDGFDVVETDSFTGVFVLDGGGEPAVSARVVRGLKNEVEQLRNALKEIADIDDWDYGLEKAKDITHKTIGEPEGWA